MQQMAPFSASLEMLESDSPVEKKVDEMSIVDEKDPSSAIVSISLSRDETSAPVKKN